MEDDVENDPDFKAWVRMREFLEGLAEHMREGAGQLREEARIAEEAAQRLDPGA